MRTCYYDVTTNGRRRWMLDDKIMVDFGFGLSAKIRKRIDYSFIADYVRREGIEFVYIRSYHNANPFTIHLVNRMKKYGAKVLMEIPTYPYDQEYITRAMKLDLFVDRRFRSRLARYLDGIVTFSNAETIFGGRTIRISNGIDFDEIPMKTRRKDTTHEMHQLGEAEIHNRNG